MGEKFKWKKPAFGSGKAKIMNTAILIISICVLVFCSYKLIMIYKEYKEAVNENEELQEQFVETPTDASGEPVETAEEEFVWDYAKCKESNSDTKGWIQQGEVINYPILQTDNNDYYLTHSVTKKKNVNGAIFIDAVITEGLEAKNCIIYGHNMDFPNNKMFSTLIEYYDEDYYKANPSFTIYIADKQYRYEVFAAYETPEVSDTYTYAFDSDVTFQQYLDSSRAKSLYTTDFRELTVNDKIITLSTCTEHESTKRFIVQLVRAEEVTDN